MDAGDAGAFWRLREAPLHRLTPEDWRRWYPTMTPWLRHADSAVREAALERLCMAVFRAEPAFRSDPDTRAQARRRAAWLLGEVDAGRRGHPELLPAFLRQLRWHGDDPPFPEVLLPWLEALPDEGGGLHELVEGMVLLVGRESVRADALWRTLDTSSDFVRACAAYLLGQTGADDPGAFDKAFLDRLTAKELARPGVVGPFWSGWSPTDHDALAFDPLLWMLDIIERRSGPEPQGLPFLTPSFAGVDVHVRELTDHSPAGVRRLLETGRADLAVRGATEHGGAVDGMADVLRELADHPDPAVAQAAHAHLARHYAERAPGAEPARIRHLAAWRPGVDAFVIRQGDEAGGRDLLVLYPAGEAFSDETAAALTDAALPPHIRGELVRHRLAEHGSAPVPVRVGASELRAYASGAGARWDGDVEGRRWRRLEISGQGLPALQDS